ncbi:hypothetical protein VTH82DRAFT_265 [Thermothelomyces myriococcoides]
MTALLRSHFITITMIASPSDQFSNFGRGAYDTTGVPKPPPPKPR